MKKAFVLCVIISMMCSMIAFADETELFFPTYKSDLITVKTPV